MHAGRSIFGQKNNLPCSVRSGHNFISRDLAQFLTFFVLQARELQGDGGGGGYVLFMHSKAWAVIRGGGCIFPLKGVGKAMKRIFVQNLLYHPYPHRGKVYNAEITTLLFSTN